MKILNLYAGIGGNRKLWGDEHEITAIEYDEYTAKIYKDFYPIDKVIVADAHEYLLQNYMNFDFIWSSPPCPTHSRVNFCSNHREDAEREVKYPCMTLYQEIILLKKYYKGIFVVENVIPYYDLLIEGKKMDRHIWWSNFLITDFKPTKKPNHETANLKDLETFFDIDLSMYKPTGVNTKIKMLRNMVHPETGLHVLNCALGKFEHNKREQLQLF